MAKYKTVAERSTSVFCEDEPSNTKAILRRVAHELLFELEKSKGQVSFVQVGANDGARGDMLNPFIKRPEWHGLLIEPVPDAMARLRAEYHGIGGLVFEQLAIWPDGTPPPFWQVIGADVLSSFSRDTIRLHEAKYDDLDGMTQKLDVRVSRLDTLCAKHEIEPDLIAVDAEGLDDMVLSTYDFENNRVPILLFEHVALGEQASMALKQRLSDCGYILIYDRHDCLCVQSPPINGQFAEFCRSLVMTARKGE